jgi:MFS family permease
MRKRANLMFACAVGGSLEWYDFFIFATCSVLVFPKQFFVVGNPLTSMLLSLATFSVAFVARPLGGIVFGAIGDRIGRRKTLIISLLMMGVSTFCVGLLPTYASIGLAAPALLVLLRVVQGLAVSGETAGSILMIAESMPREQRGFWTSFALANGPLAILLSALVINVVQGIFGNDGFNEWAWRIPFLLSALLMVVGYWTRRKVEESVAFAELLEARKTVKRAVLGEAVSGYWRQMLKAFSLKAAENTYLYVFSTFLIVFATSYLKFTRPQALSAVMWGSACEVIVILIAGYLSDRIGRRPVLLFGLVGAPLASFALFTLPPGASYMHLQLALLACLVCDGAILGPMAAYLAELFPTRIRFSALSSSYQLASVLGGAVAPIIGTLILRFTGAPIYVAVYAVVMALPAIASVFFSRESRGKAFSLAEEMDAADDDHSLASSMPVRSASIR